MKYIFYIFINIYISIKYNASTTQYLNCVTITNLDEFEILEINIIKIDFLRK